MRSPDKPRGKSLTGPAITDVAGEQAGRVQIERLVERYHWAASYCEGRTVLEVACGTGQGLGLIRSRASRIHACDLNEENLQRARMTYGHDVALAQADAHSLPFATQSIDV